MMKTLYIGLLFIAIAATAPAETITWTVSGVTFNDGGTLSGSFDFDADTGTVGSYNLLATAGSTLGAFSWTPSTATASYSSTANGGCNGPCLTVLSNATFPDCCGENESRVLTLVFDSGLTDGGGTIDLNTDSSGGSSSRDCLNCNPFRYATAGTVTGAQSPPTITGGQLPAAQVGVSYSYTIPVSGGNPPYSYTYTGTLPAGLSFANGVISGVPTGGTFASPYDAPSWTASSTNGTTTVTPDCMISVTVTDSTNTSASAAFQVAATPSSSCISFGYSATGFSGQWTFQNNAATTGTAAFNYQYTGFHAFFEVTAALQVFAGSNTVTLYNAGPVDCCTSPSGGFNVQGTGTINVTAGAPFGFIASGSNADEDDVLNGTLIITGFSILPTTTTTLTSSLNPSAPGQSITLTASVTPSTATGTITFTDGSTNIGTATLSNGTATLTIASLALGTHSITAAYGGDANDAISTSAALSQSVLQTQTITFATIPNQIFGVSPFPIAAQSNSLLPVTLTSTTPIVCKVSDDLMMLLATGMCSITASQSGNSNYLPAMSVTQTFTVRKAMPSGTLNAAPGGPLSAGSGTMGTLILDVNRDGFPDIIAVNNNTVSVLPGHGDGTFAAAMNFPVSAGTVSVAAGDFNSDGNPDLVTTSPGANTVTVLLGDGTGNFNATAFSVGMGNLQPFSVVVADFNGDGIQDLATANESGNVSILLGNGAGAFAPLANGPFSAGSLPTSLAVADLNLDGVPDLIVTDEAVGEVRVFLGNGAGGFSLAGSPYTTGVTANRIVVGDFNLDGKPDFAVTSANGETLTVMLGDGAGNFTAAANSPIHVANAPRAATMADFNGDGIPDIATYDETDNGVTVLLGDGRGGFAQSGSPFAVGGAGPFTGFYLGVGDVNGDGIEDLALPDSSNGSVTVLLGAVVPPPPPPPALTISVSPNPVVTTVGGSVMASFSASGGTGGYKFSATGLPSGVALSGNGLSGTTTQAGTFNSNIAVTDSAGAGAASSLTIDVLGLTTTSLPGGTVGQPYAATLSAIGGIAGYTFAAMGLPPGISLSTAGNLSGTPKTAAVYTVSVMVTSGAVTSTASLSLTIAKATPVTISNATLPGGKVSVAYSQAFSATGGVPPYTWALSSGALPPGLSLSAAGIVSGMPATANTYTFGVMATDTAGGTAVAGASITIQPASLQVTTLSLPTGMFGVPYPMQQITVNGGMPPFTFTVSDGTLPSGLTLSSDGVLSGTPQPGGTSSSIRPALVAHASNGTNSFGFGITVTDAAGAQTTIQFPLAIRQPSADLILTAGTLSFALSNPAQSPPVSQVVGIQSTDPTKILSYTLAVNPAVAWLATANGSMTPDSIQAAITPSALTLSPGAYNTTITATCTSAACAGSTQRIQVTLTVTALPPALQVSTNLLSFATTNTSIGSLSGTINVSNAGGGTLGFASVACEASYCTAGPAPQNLAGGVGAVIPLAINAASLGPGFYRTQVDISTSGGKASVPVTLFISASATMTLAPSGTQFNQLQGSAPGFASGSFLVAVNSTTAVNYTASIASIQNVAAASWLVLQTYSGAATSNSPGTVSFAIDPAAAAQLPAGVYYAIISVASPDVSNSPQDYEVVLNVAPANTPVAPELQPAGLLFIQSGNGLPAPQVVNVYSASSQPATYQAAATTVSGGNWLSVTPGTASSSSTAPGVSTVSVDTSKLGPGVYYGGITYSLSATAVRTVNVTLIIPAAGTPTSSTSSATTSSPTPANASPRAAGCTPSKLVPAQTGLVNSFSAPAGWPTPLGINLADDCGNLITDGRIVATFSNGDPPLILPLADQNTALYSGTWAPAHASSQITISVTASAQGLATAAAQISGAVAPNPVPVISPNAALHVFDPLVGGALAPGTIIAIYGQFLATGTSSATTIPLPTLYNDAAVTIGNYYAPIYYASPTQVNVQVPFELTPGQQYDVFVSVAGKLSTPQPIQLSDVAPGLAAYTSGGLIAQHQADGSLITATSPAVPGEYVQAYLAGLGATTVTVPSGAASPSSPLAMPSDMPALMINGSSYPIYFVGLTPTLVGLYQIDFQMPAGLPAGNLTVSIVQNGASSNQTTLPYQP